MNLYELIKKWFNKIQLAKIYNEKNINKVYKEC